ncbi:MAG: protein kinase [Chloroflexota bacterium]|nr:protein kinase [Chloroflexota bacterium]
MTNALRVCPNCWTPYPPGAKRCPRCGFDLQGEETTSFINLFGPPDVLRRYEIQDTLASSQVGHVYQALDLETDDPCAIKELSGAALTDSLEAERAAVRLERRVRQLSHLSHPNLVSIHHLLSEGSRHFVIMDLVEGPTLEEVLERRDRPVPEPVILQWGANLCDALELLHDQNPPLLFPDLTPHHVILASDSQPILVDLGLSRLFEDRHGKGEGVAGDVAALGALLYRALTLHDLPSGRPSPLRKLNPDLSVATVEAIEQATSRRPEERFLHTAQFKKALLAQAPSVEDITAVIPHIEPYKLTPGSQARNLQELVQLCQENWEAGVDQFLAGNLTAWLREVAGSLSEAGQDRAAQEVSAAAEKGEELRQEAQGASAVQQQAAFFRWLTSTGHAWGQPELAADVSYLRLGAVKGKLRLGAIFEVENRGRGFLTGEVKSQVGWILVRREEFGCRGGETAEITVELRDRSALSRPTSSDRALHITSNGGEAWVGASIAAPRPMLALAQKEVDFGEVQVGEPARSEISIRNEGGRLLTGQVSSTVPWLRVHPAHFRCPAGQATSVEIELETESLSKGTTIQDSAITVDSDYGQARVRVKVTQVQPHLKLLSEELDFGAIVPVCRISRMLRVINEGTGDLDGAVSSQVDWLSVEETTFHCRPKQTALITVWADPISLPGGEMKAPEALIIESNGGHQTISARLTVRRPQLRVDRRALDFGTLLPGQERELSLSVGNEGVTPLYVELVPRTEWLKVEPSQITCATGEEAEIVLTLRVPRSAKGGELQVDEALYLASDGGVANLSLRAEIISPRLEVDPHHLDFGLIGPAEVTHGQLHIRNAGSGTLDWHLPVVGELNWLDISPRQGSCGPGEEAIIEVNGFALGLPKGTTSAKETLHITSNGGQFEIPISVAIAEPALSLLPFQLDMGISENYAPLEGRLRISNHGGGHLTGEVASQVAWLDVEPTNFDCAAGGVAEVRVSADPKGLPKGETFVGGALVVTSNGGRERVGVRLEVVLKPILEVNPEELTIPASREEDIVTNTLTLINQGYGAPKVRCQPTVDWLATDRGFYTLRHGRSTQVRVKADLAGRREGDEGRQRALLNIRDGEEMLISVPITIAEE